MSYDLGARRLTPLALRLGQRIGRDGPLPVADYMRLCLAACYERQDVLGERGDFITAPEVSQVFGELIGLWCAVVWRQMGSPGAVHLVELGPGRGTLLVDALRAARIVPGFGAALRLQCVEASRGLADVQRQVLARAGVAATWHGSLEQLGSWPFDGPAIVLANELLDALPVTQLVRAEDGWRLRAVGLDAADRLQLSLHPDRPSLDGPDLPHARVGDVLEHRSLSPLWRMLARSQPVAALFIDYGHLRSRTGDSLQAVRGHAFEHPLTSPGEADLSAQVDFERLAAEARDAGLAVDGPVTQAELLGALGAVERARALIAANPARRNELETGVARLIAPDAMGTRFKAIGLRSAGLPPLPGFGP